MLKIGQVAAQSGVSVDAVRFYERIGLLPKAGRRASGYRAFEPDAVQRIRLIRDLAHIGLTLDEIGTLVRSLHDPEATCSSERGAIERALARVETQLAALRSVRVGLRSALDRCDRGECDLVSRAQTLIEPPAKRRGQRA